MPSRDSIDFPALAEELLRNVHGNLARWLPGGKLHGQEYVVRNPTRNDRKPGSFKVNVQKGSWSEFSSNAPRDGGDLISLYGYLNGISNVEAAKRLLAGRGDFDAVQRPSERAAKPAAEWVHVIPAPEGVEPPEHPTHGCLPASTWAYRTTAGELIGYTCRFDMPEGKEFSSYAYFRNASGKEAWRWLTFGKPRPLYGLETLAGDKPVIVVEGEKAANAGRTLYPNHVVLAWPGGVNADRSTDFSPLAGRDVILWPDNDEPGRAAMDRVAETLSGVARSVRVIVPPPNCPEGWDIADAGWSLEEAGRFLEPPVATVGEEPEQEYETPARVTESDASYFVCLGTRNGSYFYHAHGTQQVVELSAAQHSKTNLLALAPLHWWEGRYVGGGKEKVNWDMATNEMFRTSERVGIFDANRIRGRGAWYDDGRIVLNLGNRVVIGGDWFHPAQTPSEFIYEAGPTMKADISSPLTARQANKFYELIEMLPWERRIYARLLAGWCVCAHIGGALEWRPHIWITAKKGTGKSWVTDKIVGKILGSNCLAVISESTGPGIRQSLGSDSIPVTFDEAEGNTVQAVMELQKVLTLARQSSSDGDAKIVKGGADGDPNKYHVRSCFMFSSIAASLMQESDKSRVTLLELNKDKQHRSFENEIAPFREAMLTPEYQQKFYARAIKLAPVIRKNARTFAGAVARMLGEQRAGDQYGALLAGAFSLHSNLVISKEDAERWVAEQDWQIEQETVAGMTDEARLMQHLTNCRTKFRSTSQGMLDDVPIGELIDSACGLNATCDIPKDRAFDTLSRIGIKVTESHIYIANDYLDIRKLLENTPWQADYSTVLRRLPGADAPGKTHFRHSASSMRCTRIPLEAMRG